MREQLYMGIDFSEDYVMISYYSYQTKEPETISPIAGSKIYKIPFSLAKKSGISQWYYGLEAKKAVEEKIALEIQDLFHTILTQEVTSFDGENYKTIDLLTLFFHKIIILAKRISGLQEIGGLSIAFEEVDTTKINICRQLAEQLGVKKEIFFVLDKKESFYYYALSQNPKLWQSDCATFHLMNEDMRVDMLHRNQKTYPQLIEIQSEQKKMDMTKIDESFLELIKEVLPQRTIGTVYLVGDVFEEDWMKESLKNLCLGRRVFIGKNLYSKGACVATLVKTNLLEWQFAYLGNHEMKFNLCIMIKNKKDEVAYTLISAGSTWYEAKTSCEVILEDEPLIEFLFTYPDKSEQKRERMKLDELPIRPPKATRLRIGVEPVSDYEVEIIVKDLGFGEFFASSEKTWKKRVCF